MNFDIKDVKSWANRHDVETLSVTGFFGNSLLEIDNEIRRYNKGEKGHLHELYQISDNGCFCFGYATYFADTGAFCGTSNFAFFLPLDAVKKDKSSDDNSVPHYHFNGGEIERLTDEELKELGALLNMGISYFLDTSFVIGSEDGKQQAIKRANIYKSIYNKLIKPIYRVDE